MEKVENTKTIKVFSTNNIRLLIEEMNKLEIKKEDVITILRDDHQYFIIYQK